MLIYAYEYIKNKAKNIYNISVNSKAEGWMT